MAARHRVGGHCRRKLLHDDFGVFRHTADVARSGVVPVPVRILFSDNLHGVDAVLSGAFRVEGMGRELACAVAYRPVVRPGLLCPDAAEPDTERGT